MALKNEKIGEILLRKGLLTQVQLAKALELQALGSGDPLGALLVKNGVISEEVLATTLSGQLGIPLATKANHRLVPAADQGLEKLITEEVARKYCLIPVAHDGKSITIVFSDPTDVLLIDNLRKLKRCNIKRLIGLKSEVEEAISNFYGEGGMLKSAVEASYGKVAEVRLSDEERGQISLDDLVASAEKAPVVNLADLLIRQAIKQRASDIHIEPMYDTASIRFRIDGVLQEVPPPDKAMLLPLVSRLKIISKMDIAEKRLPQDGSFRAGIENRLIDFRVSTIPTVNGEKMVLRILDRSSLSLDLEALGFETYEKDSFTKAINRPYGMILITGPTGSGKTTTLYCALNQIKGKEKNIITIEDPVEYQISGINQVQVKPSIGLTFASGLRSFLRQDPDVILVGETRDLETAQICVRAALTGHLVFTTLHTNDAPSAVTRLVDIGIEPFFVTSSLLMIVAQRLVRRLCPQCKEAQKVDASTRPLLLRSFKGPLYQAKGCEACSQTGYKGRLAIFEIMNMSEEIERLILARSQVSQVREAARKAGMSTLEESGYKKAMAGETSVEEIMRITMANI